MTDRLGRRAFLGALPAAIVAACGGGMRWPGATTGGGAPAPPLRGFGVQLYTLRSVIASDLDRTLARLVDIGYTAVEFAGLYGVKARDMRRKLDAVGLSAASSHQSLGDVRGDWARCLDDARELGQELVVVASVPGDERDAESLRRVADDFDLAGEAARGAGLRFGYHNHDWEFEPFADGTLPMELLLERTDADLVDWQMDVFWTVHGGADPAGYLQRHGGRVTSVHVKDRTADGRMVDVGDGVIDFASLLRAAESAGLMHAFVEHDRPGDPLESVRRSLAHLRTLRM